MPKLQGRFPRLFADPVLRSLEGLLPLSVQPFALFLTHLRFVAAPELPLVLELLAALPESGSQPRQVRRPQSGGLHDLRHLYGYAQDVGLKLHQSRVDGRPAVGPELL